MGRREPFVINMRRVVASHLVCGGEEAVVTVAKVAIHVIFVHGKGNVGERVPRTSQRMDTSFDAEIGFGKLSASLMRYYQGVSVSCSMCLGV